MLSGEGSKAKTSLLSVYQVFEVFIEITLSEATNLIAGIMSMNSNEKIPKRKRVIKEELVKKFFHSLSGSS